MQQARALRLSARLFDAAAMAAAVSRTRGRWIHASSSLEMPLPSRPDVSKNISRMNMPPEGQQQKSEQKSKIDEWLNPPPPPTELLQRMKFKLSDACSMTIYYGDISKWNVDGLNDAIVAPANKRLNAGAAVDGVIHKAAGPRLLSACQKLPDVAPLGIKCNVGEAVSTRAYNLLVSRVIHTVGPVFEGKESDPVLEQTYKSALALGLKENIKFICFPALSCRIYGYPYSEGAEVAIKTVKENFQGYAQVDFAIRNIEGYECWIDEAFKHFTEIKQK
ncbi:uncharacterized protein LOC9644583 [Selaginella moellendorffii]|uniref:uncharacterized protein LOC9637506 n=1 Tax=Selaginella moellendorffii TaxID=88036 RepID=UPI000D1C2F69|nr:uncharacterized protein LOC9637506 [Selaginella moellendorffii]XP_024545320.1 uncharacterized protein LOC9644583 [Selaginella moellendorffii]|eukprot:XP_002972850.2 uncharacterized protein LOC9637506 [Selaginella moellendorffii]